VQVRSPVFEEAVTQVSTVEAGIHGRPLTRAERQLLESVFGNSLDYSRVQLIPTTVLEFRTVGNTTRVPKDFSITNPDHAQTLVHEMTHVWQYQHSGTSYISISLTSQLIATIRSGSRNAAYDYQLSGRSSFYDFGPEQQALIVENYFGMKRDQSAPATGTGQFRSNHMDSGGRFTWLSYADRQSEISRELPLHERMIAQLRASLPRSEHDVLIQRASEVMGGSDILRGIPPSRDTQLTPVKPLFEVRW
jgi:hypothetical protein